MKANVVRRPTSAWTDQHTQVAAALVAALGGCLVGLGESESVPFWVAAAVSATAVASLRFDAFGGIVAGLAAAAVLIGAKHVTGRWNVDAFALSLAETLVLVLVGAMSGVAGTGLRRSTGGEQAAPGALAPVFGSLGLLGQDVAMHRLEEEIERAHAHRRPLTLLMVYSEIVDQSLDSDACEEAHRAVARIFESRLHERDVPFAISSERLGAILPEATALDAWERVGTVLDAIAGASFMVRSSAARVPTTDAVHVHVGLAELSPQTSSADAMLDAATAHIQSEKPAPL